jgi:hypothetical protein
MRWDDEGKGRQHEKRDTKGHQRGKARTPWDTAGQAGTPTGHQRESQSSVGAVKARARSRGHGSGTRPIPHHELAHNLASTSCTTHGTRLPVVRLVCVCGATAARSQERANDANNQNSARLRTFQMCDTRQHHSSPTLYAIRLKADGTNHSFLSGPVQTRCRLLGSRG